MKRVRSVLCIISVFMCTYALYAEDIYVYEPVKVPEVKIEKVYESSEENGVPVKIIKTRTVTEYRLSSDDEDTEAGYVDEESANDYEQTDSKQSDSVQVDFVSENQSEPEVSEKDRNRGSIGISASYFMPVSEVWADAVLPVISGNLTFTTAKAMFGESSSGFSLSLRGAYMYLREKGVNSFRDHKFYFSMPLNLQFSLFKGQSVTFGAGPYLSLSYIREKSIYSDNWDEYTKSGFGVEGLIRFSYELSPALVFNVEANSLIPIINRDFISIGIGAGLSCRF